MGGPYRSGRWTGLFTLLEFRQENRILDMAISNIPMRQIRSIAFFQCGGGAIIDPLCGGKHQNDSFGTGGGEAATISGSRNNSGDIWGASGSSLGSIWDDLGNHLGIIQGPRPPRKNGIVLLKIKYILSDHQIL